MKKEKLCGHDDGSILNPAHILSAMYRHIDIIENLKETERVKPSVSKFLRS